MKRHARITLALVLALLAGVMAGCEQNGAATPFTAGNEIVTYERIDPQKTQLVLSRTGNIPAEGLIRAFTERNPDIQVIYLDITGGNSDYKPLIEWVKGGHAPDVIISASSFFDAELTKQYFVDQSENPVIQNYEAAALQRTATDGLVYWLPGPSDISAMVYNKTMFDQYGWTVPVTFDEFVALCDRIRADTNGEVEAWNPNAKYENELITAIEAMVYSEMLGGVENRMWYDSLRDGKATLSEHMAPYVNVIQTLLDHDILREEHFSYSATTRGKEFRAGKIAMVNGTIFSADNDTYDFELMPFPTTQGSLGYLCDSYSCFVGVPIKKHTEKESDAIARFLAFFSTPEGQAAYTSDTMKISNVKGTDQSMSDDMAGLLAAAEAGHLFAHLDFLRTNAGAHLLNLHDMTLQMLRGETDGMAYLSAADARLSAAKAAPVSAPAAPAAAPAALTAATKDFTVLETSFLIADAYRDIADADIGLITHNEIFRGNMMRVYQGDIRENMLTVFKPRSFANNSTLVKVNMTGRQIMDALNHPVGNDSPSNSVYAYSGLKCEVAPWNELGKRYLSVKRADGSALQMDKQYTVAFWAGTVADAYITETPQTFEGTWETLMTAYLREHPTLTPASDSRIKLIWK